MVTQEKTISVPQAAALCGVNRATINTWINNKKLYAFRSGRNYRVPKNELLFFLKSTGRDFPPELQRHELRAPLFKTFRFCWEYPKDRAHEAQCKGCVVLGKKLEVCFTARESFKLDCPVDCYECSYYQDIFLPRFQFIHQFDFPAAIYKGFFFWDANVRMAEIAQAPQKEFPGKGMEKLIHPESLESMISTIRKMELGESIPMTFNVFLKSETKRNLGANISLIPLNEPSGAFLFLAKVERG
jgi:excisionase family DNA binding protein